MASKQKDATERDPIEVSRSSPKSTLEEVAGALGVARSTAHKRLAAAIAEGQVQRHVGGREGRRKLPDRYTAIRATVVVNARGATRSMSEKVSDSKEARSAVGMGTNGKVSSRSSKQKGAGPTTNASGRKRLRRGELGGLVLSQMRKGKDELPASPTTIEGDRALLRCGRQLPRASGRFEVIANLPASRTRRNCPSCCRVADISEAYILDSDEQFGPCLSGLS